MKRLLCALGLLGLLITVVPQPVSASYDPFNVNCAQGSGAAGSAVCTEKPNVDNPLTGCNSQGKNCGTGLLMKITNIVAYVAGGAAVILIVIGAIRYVTSGSDTSVGNRIDDDVLNAKRTITNALIGLAVIVLAKTIITYVILHVH